MSQECNPFVFMFLFCSFTMFYFNYDALDINLKKWKCLQITTNYYRLTNDENLFSFQIDNYYTIGYVD